MEKDLKQYDLFGNTAMAIDEISNYLGRHYTQTQNEIKSRITPGTDKKTELLIKREIKTLAIKDQENSGVVKDLTNWALDKTNDVTVIIAFSGGKDSVACVLHLLDLGFDKSKIELWHHEIDGGGENLFDWKCTPSYCQAFADAFGLPILFSYAKGGIEREILKKDELSQPVYFQQTAGGEYFKISPSKEASPNTRYKFPAVTANLQTRWCSSIAKIDVMAKAINNSERFKKANLLIVSGERRLESTARSLYLEVEKYRSFSKTRKAINWKAIVTWTEMEVWDIMKKYSVQPHPCYELGWGRCSCQLCIFSQKNTWKSIEELNPEKISRIAEIENQIGHTLYNVKGAGGGNAGIYEAMVNKGESFIKENAKARWAHEANNKFISPIFVKEWRLPDGANNKENCGAN